MEKWISELISHWPHSSNWREALFLYLKQNGFNNQERIGESFDLLRGQPDFNAASTEILQAIIEAGHLDRAIENLVEFLQQYKEKSGKTFDLNHKHLPSLIRLFGWSGFLSRWLIQRPERVGFILNSNFLDEEKSCDIMLQELGERFQLLGNLDEKGISRELRRYKYEEYARVTLKDLGNLADDQETWRELSFVAEASLKFSLAAAFELAMGGEEVNLYSPPVSEREIPFLVIGMGKLGGAELNYSSDVDLIFLYHEESESNSGKLLDEKIRRKIGQILIRLMAERNEEGFICRVDMRLRPGGEQTPLVCSINKAESFYENQGLLWERQAWIKARTVCGAPEMAELLTQLLRPFIFSRSIDDNTVKEINVIKKRIEVEHLKENHLNVKLGVGGIREIEFFVQCFQILYGGYKPEHRNSNTLIALNELAKAKIVTKSDADYLRTSYLFLRRLEHRLQMIEEEQTHIVPLDEKIQQAIARSLGYLEEHLSTARRHFLQDVKDHMIRVRSIFILLFDHDYKEIEAAIRSATRFNNFTPDVDQLINDVARQVASALKNQNQETLFQRFQQLFDRIGAKLQYYQNLIKHPSHIQRLSRIAATSDFLWNYLINHLDLLYQLDASEVLHTKSDWEQQLDQLFSKNRDEEKRIEILREFKHTVTFLIGSAELDGIISFQLARHRLTQLAEVILQQAFFFAKELIDEKFEPSQETGHLAILAYGKFGGKEMTYHSDLDLVFVYFSPSKGDLSTLGFAQNYFGKLIRKLISLLSMITKNGFAYELDTRLRPSGTGGAVITSDESFFKYHKTSKSWEHQALLKARVLAGNLTDQQEQTFNSRLQQTKFSWVPPEDLADTILHMRLRKEKELSKENERRKNLKEGKGGLLDIEYLTQYLQLQHGRKLVDCCGTETLLVLEQLHKIKVLSDDDFQHLTHAYLFIRKIENYMRLLHDESTNLLDFEKVDTSQIALLLKEQGYEIESLFKSYLETANKVREIFEQLMKNTIPSIS